MTSFKRFGFKLVVKYAYIGISTDRQRHNLFWLFHNLLHTEVGFLIYCLRAQARNAPCALN